MNPLLIVLHLLPLVWSASDYCDIFINHTMCNNVVSTVGMKYSYFETHFYIILILLSACFVYFFPFHTLEL